MHPRFRSAALALVVLIPAAAAAAEPTSVQVALWNKPNGMMGITLSRAEAPAGPIEFHVRNTSHTLMHEFLVIPWPGDIKSLPYNAKEQQVREGELPGMQGIEDMPPGTAATVRLVLKPGKYVVICNQPEHYKAGMARRFTVTR